MSNKNNITGFHSNGFHSLNYVTGVFTSATALLRSPTQPPGDPSSRC